MKNNPSSTEENEVRGKLRADLQGELKKLRQTESKLTQARTDLTKLEAAAQKIRPADYSSEARARHRAIMDQIESCTIAIEELETECGEYTDALHSLLQEGSQSALRILQPIMETCIKTVTASLAPFSESEESAKTLAGQTDVVRAAHMALYSFGTLQQFSRGSAGKVIFAADRILAVFIEAEKSSPDLIRFIRPGAVQSDMPTASIGASDQSS